MRDIEELIERWDEEESVGDRVQRLGDAIEILETHLKQHGNVTKTEAYNFITSQIEHYKYLKQHYSEKKKK